MPSGDDAMHSKLGKYVILDRLGKGGMGDVFLGEDQRLARKVAIKVMSKKLTDDPSFVERFRREARAAAAVPHPNCTQIHELDNDGGVEFFVMEYVSGGTLADRLADGRRLPPARALDVILQAARGLQAAARANLIHRDIKPSNILITEEGQVKLTDFGLAKALEDQSKLTRTDVILGTPHYVSPEQARGEEGIDFRSDIYSLGVTLYQALSGSLPFTATTPMGIMLRHINDPLPPISESCPGLPETVTALVHRMLEKQPDRRQASYGELIEEIEAALAQTPPDLILPDASPRRSPKPDAPTAPQDPTQPTPSTPSPAPAKKEASSAPTALTRAPSRGEEGETKTPATLLTPSEGSVPAPPPSPAPASPLLIKPRGFFARLKRQGKITWGLLRRPGETWEALEPEVRQTKESVKRGVRALVAISLLAFTLWGPGGIVVMLAFGLFHVLDVFFTVPALAMSLPAETRPDRFRGALAFVCRSWSANVPMAATPLGLLLLIWYPFVAWKGIGGYLRVRGSRQALVMLFWCAALMGRLLGVGIFLRILGVILRGLGA